MQAFGKLDGSAFHITNEKGDTVIATIPAGAFALVNATLVDGATVLSLPSGESISVRTNGNVETRAAGTQGPWERGRADSSTITYVPDATIGLAFVFGLKPTL